MKNNINLWSSNERSFPNNKVFLFKESEYSITNLQINDTDFVSKDEKNEIRLSKINNFINLSRNPNILVKQINDMNINSLSKKDSINYGLFRE